MVRPSVLLLTNILKIKIKIKPIIFFDSYKSQSLVNGDFLYLQYGE